VLGVRSSSGFGADSLVAYVPPDASDDDVAGRLSVFAQYAPTIRQLDRELEHIQRLARTLNGQFNQTEHEMQLAAKLQRDFLPRSLPSGANFRFHAMYRPATWISGDIYDVFAIDDSRVGIFLADAVGHGLAAGLLTMFVRRSISALCDSRDGRTDLKDPAAIIDALNTALLKQGLPTNWFITAAYLAFNTETLELKHARGGHPYPLRIDADGNVSELRASGALLGVADMEGGFEGGCAQLQRGDKVIIYSDGLEELFVADRDPVTAELMPSDIFAGWKHLPAEELLRQLTDLLDNQEGSLHQPDDMTLILLEIDEA
jgi:serine phosphatase RsbU (regulator of sigma subunit)